MERRAGIEVRVGGRGRTARAFLSSTRSSVDSSSPLTGSLPCSEMYDSISRCSKMFPWSYVSTCIPRLKLMLPTTFARSDGDLRDFSGDCQFH